MNFYNVVKWVLSVVVLGIIVVGIMSTPDQPSSKPVVQNQQSQSKFNF